LIAIDKGVMGFPKTPAEGHNISGNELLNSDWQQAGVKNI